MRQHQHQLQLIDNSSGSDSGDSSNLSDQCPRQKTATTTNNNNNKYDATTTTMTSTTTATDDDDNIDDNEEDDNYIYSNLFEDSGQ